MIALDENRLREQDLRGHGYVTGSANVRTASGGQTVGDQPRRQADKSMQSVARGLLGVGRTIRQWTSRYPWLIAGVGLGLGIWLVAENLRAGRHSTSWEN